MVITRYVFKYDLAEYDGTNGQDIVDANSAIWAEQPEFSWTESDGVLRITQNEADGDLVLQTGDFMQIGSGAMWTAYNVANFLAPLT